jgi:hypothetical protein
MINDLEFIVQRLQFCCRQTHIYIHIYIYIHIDILVGGAFRLASYINCNRSVESVGVRVRVSH